MARGGGHCGFVVLPMLVCAVGGAESKKKISKRALARPVGGWWVMWIGWEKGRGGGRGV